MTTRSDSSRGNPWGSSLTGPAEDPQTAAEGAVLTGTATLAQYARWAQSVIPRMRRYALQQVIATEARERAGLTPPSTAGWTSVTMHRLAAYPLGCPMPAEVTLAVEEAVEIALTVPSFPGLLPDQARLREECALTVLVLGDETGDRLRRRVWSHKGDAWHFATDLVLAAQKSGLPAAAADKFMGVPAGYFEERLGQGLIELANQPDRSAGVVTYYDMSKCTRPSDAACHGQMWSD